MKLRKTNITSSLGSKVENFGPEKASQPQRTQERNGDMIHKGVEVDYAMDKARIDSSGFDIVQAATQEEGHCLDCGALKIYCQCEVEDE